MLNRHGGVTTNLKGDIPTEGLAFALRKETERPLDGKNFTRVELEKYIEAHWDELQEDGSYVGLWKDAGKVYLGVSRVVQDESQEVEAAKKADQIAIYIKNGQTRYIANYKRTPWGTYQYQGKKQAAVAGRTDARGLGPWGLARKFDPDQPRDDHGRCTDGGAEPAAGAQAGGLPDRGGVVGSADGVAASGGAHHSDGQEVRAA